PGTSTAPSRRSSTRPSAPAPGPSRSSPARAAVSSRSGCCGSWTARTSRPATTGSRRIPRTPAECSCISSTDGDGSPYDRRMSDPPRWWDSALDVEQFALQAADSACSAARRLAAARDRDLRLEVNRERIPAAYAALEHLRIDGRPTSPWAPLSGFVAARDGWVRLHGNYPHHAAAIERALGVRTREQLLAAASDRTAQEVEDAVRAN